MKKFIISILILQIGYLINLSSQTTRGMKVTAIDPQTGEQIGLYKDSWAVLIGINKYQNVDRLNYAVADAEEIKKMLVNFFNFKPEHIILLTDEKATKKGIMEAFATLLETSPEDRVIIFFAGHGTQTDLPGGGEMGYLVPVEGKIKSRSELYTTCISMEELKNISKQIPAKHVLCLVDACYGGLAAVATRALSRETQMYLQKITTARARQIITAGGRGELAVENPDWGHSAFTKSLIEGLEKKLADADGNNLVTASELVAYLKPRVSASSEYKQTPQFKSFTDDEGDFVFVLPTIYELQISSTPSSAIVKIDGQEIGKTPLIQKMEMGEYSIELILPGYQPYKEIISLNKDKKISAVLKEELYELAITSNPGDAEVFINGIPQEKRTTLVTKVKPGSYTIEIVKEGYEKWTQKIDVKTNQTITADLKPEEITALEKEMETKFKPQKSEETKRVEPKEKPVEQRPQEEITESSSPVWWIVGGAAVIGGGVTYLLLSKSTPSSSGMPNKLPDPPPFPNIPDVP